jgi:hypothetical protein
MEKGKIHGNLNLKKESISILKNLISNILYGESDTFQPVLCYIDYDKNLIFIG